MPPPPDTSSQLLYANLRNGIPVRMTGWMSIRVGRLSRRQPRFAKLQGEVLSFHAGEHHLPDDQFDIVGASVDYSDKETKKSFKLIAARTIYTCYCGSFEEMQSWAQSLCFASQRCFQRYYTLGSLIAEGSFSRVYYAYDVDDPKHVFAVKVIKKRTHDIQAMEWVNRERHVNSMLNHRTIVHAVDMFSTTDKDHIVFELMRGGTLADLLSKHNKLPESYARVVMRELLTALDYIHSKNIVHRDVRPDNIFCSAAKFPMSIALGDFGYANFVSEKRVNRDVLTTMIGTTPYIAIDICRRISYGPLADMWSAGVVLYEILSGLLPFTGRSDREVVEKIKKGVVSFESPVWKTISSEAKGLILQLLQTDPHKRISALAALQHRWLQQAPLSRPASINTSCPTSPPVSSGFVLGDRNSPVNSTDSRRPNHISNSGSNMSRIPSNASIQSTDHSNGTERHDWSERQMSAVMSMQGGGRSIHAVSSLSSLSAAGQPRIQATPSVRAIVEKGLQRVASDNPARMKRLLSSSVVQKQLSAALPYRRRLIVVARVFVAVFRLKALSRGHSSTRQLSLMGKGDVDIVNALIDRRKAAMERDNEESKLRDDRVAGQPLSPHSGRRGGHVRQRSRDVAAQLIGKMSVERKQQ